MTIAEIIEGLNNGDIDKVGIGEMYGRSYATIDQRLRRVISYDRKVKSYKIIEGQEAWLEKEFSELLKNEPIKRKKASKVASKKPVKASESLAEASKSLVEASKVARGGGDLIGALLNGTTGKPTGKHYKGFYIDKDIAKVIDKVPSRMKSQLVNEILRKELEARGLL